MHPVQPPAERLIPVTGGRREGRVKEEIDRRGREEKEGGMRER